MHAVQEVEPQAETLALGAAPVGLQLRHPLQQEVTADCQPEQYQDHDRQPGHGCTSVLQIFLACIMVGDSGAGMVLVATGTLLSRNQGSLDELPQPVSQA